MPKIICIVGKICCGKTTYAKTLPGIVLSVDDFMLPLFGQHCEMIEAKIGLVQDCLLQQAVAITNAGLDVIFDWGFWRRAEREKVVAFCDAHDITLEWRYISIPEKQRQKQIAQRNHVIEQGLKEYYVSPGLYAKCDELFEEPEEIHDLKRV